MNGVWRPDAGKGQRPWGHPQGRAAATSLSCTSKPTVCSEELRSPSLGETDVPLMARRKMLHVEDAEGGRGCGVSSLWPPREWERPAPMSHPPFPVDCESRPLTGSFTCQGSGVGRPIKGLPPITYGPPKPNGTTVLLAKWGLGQSFSRGTAVPLGSGSRVGSVGSGHATPHRRHLGERRHHWSTS